jgi:hypothetical protein
MGSMMKFVVGTGAILGIAGVFLPLAEVSTRTGGMGGVLSLGVSLWEGASVGGIGFIAYVTLALFALAGIFAALGARKGFGRGLATGALLASLGPAALAVSWMMQALSLGAAGAGLYLLAAGGVLAAVGSFVTLIRPERHGASPAAERRAVVA